MSVLLIEHHRGHAVACNTEKRGPQFYWVLGETHMGYFQTAAAVRQSIDDRLSPPQEPQTMSTKEKDVLCAAGLALYGDSWQSAMARALGVSDRTVRRWMSGQSAMPVGCWPQIEQLLDQRFETLTTIRDTIKGQKP